MNILILILAVTALTALGWLGAYVYELVATDGYGRRQQPPRSHAPDDFDPHLGTHQHAA